jgi:hypothetical protein
MDLQTEVLKIIFRLCKEKSLRLVRSNSPGIILRPNTLCRSYRVRQLFLIAQICFVLALIMSIPHKSSWDNKLKSLNMT